MLDRIQQYITDNQLIPKKNTVLFVAVSGGIDSVVLLDVLFRLRSAFKYQIHVLHFNHNVRGEAADADQEFVAGLARKYSITAHFGRLRTRYPRLSETVLREERYKFFQKYLDEYPSALIATGHNQDDRVETFLMRLLKGSRLQGLSSIQPRRGRFIRPLLAIHRAEIENFAQTEKLEFREDHTNADTSIIRNRLRHELIPNIEQNFAPDIRAQIVRTMSDIEYHLLIFQEELKKAVTASTKKLKSGITLNRKRYQEFNPAIRRGLVEYCISSVYPLNYSLSERNFSIWDEFIMNAQPGKKQSFLEHGMALAERNIVLFGDLPGFRHDRYMLTPGKELKIEQKYLLTMQPVERDAIRFSRRGNIEFVDGEKTGQELTVRFWKEGDSFRPIGMKHRRKLSDFFIDIKLSARYKSEVPLVCRGEEIIWIAGYRLDERYKISDKTKNIYKLEIQRLKTE